MACQFCPASAGPRVMTHVLFLENPRQQYIAHAACVEMISEQCRRLGRPDWAPMAIGKVWFEEKLH